MSGLYISAYVCVYMYINKCIYIRTYTIGSNYLSLEGCYLYNIYSCPQNNRSEKYMKKYIWVHNVSGLHLCKRRDIVAVHITGYSH